MQENRFQAGFFVPTVAKALFFTRVPCSLQFQIIGSFINSFRKNYSLRKTFSKPFTGWFFK